MAASRTVCLGSSAYGSIECRRTVVARSNCSRIVVVTTTVLPIILSDDEDDDDVVRTVGGGYRTSVDLAGCRAVHDTTG